jgi:hypothetical protein
LSLAGELRQSENLIFAFIDCGNIFAAGGQMEEFETPIVVQISELQGEPIAIRRKDGSDV